MLHWDYETVAICERLVKWNSQIYLKIIQLVLESTGKGEGVLSGPTLLIWSKLKTLPYGAALSQACLLKIQHYNLVLGLTLDLLT